MAHELMAKVRRKSAFTLISQSLQMKVWEDKIPQQQMG